MFSKLAGIVFNHSTLPQQGSSRSHLSLAHPTSDSKSCMPSEWDLINDSTCTPACTRSVLKESRRLPGPPTHPNASRSAESSEQRRQIASVSENGPALTQSRSMSRSITEPLYPRRPAHQHAVPDYQPLNELDFVCTDPRSDVVPGIPETAICVRDVDVQCVLQFTLINAASCALHRRTSRVIHRLELYRYSF